MTDAPRPLTVRDLIAALSKLDGDMPVALSHIENYWIDQHGNQIAPSFRDLLHPGMRKSVALLPLDFAPDAWQRRTEAMDEDAD